MLALLLLAGCGGGGSDPPSAGGSASASATALAGGTDAPGSTSDPGSVPDAGAAALPTATCGLSDFAAQALARVNALRAAGASCGTRGVFAPTTALSWNARLIQAADGHSNDMSTQNYFSHVSLDGRTFDVRIDATGYAWSKVGENIAVGHATVDQVMAGWAASPGHCANLMDPAFSEIGLSCVPGTPTSSYNTYWSMELGRPR